ncbi:MAG TPA: hypothetical protein VFX19_05810, partial [Dehalococcoidia bacterium]|nr:hypothetical protein [Dehalococcoidia bacterium]
MLQRPRLWLFVIVAVAIFAAGAFLLTGGDSATPLNGDSEPSPLDIENENAVVDPSAKGPFPLTPGLYVFDTETGEVRRVLDQKGDNFGFDTATTYQWSQDGEWLVSTSVGNVNKIIAVSRDGSRRREAAGQSWTVQRQDDGAFVLHMRPVSETDEEQPEILGRLDLDTMAVSELVKSNGGAVSPDGRYVAQVTNDGALVLTDVTTGETRTLYSIPRNEGWISLPAGPVWSPDGKSLLLQESRRDRPALLAVDAEGTNEPARLDELVVEAEWSPDGKSVAYVTYVEGPPAFPYPGETYVWEPESNSAPRRIIDGSSPAWSPTGGSLAFTRNGSLWRIDIASGTQQPLLRAAMPILDEPRWSPDGRYIAFRAQNVGGEIRAIDVDGPNERYLGLGASASYSPDGERIAFMAGSGGLGFAGNLMAMQADGTRIVA